MTSGEDASLHQRTRLVVIAGVPLCVLTLTHFLPLDPAISYAVVFVCSSLLYVLLAWQLQRSDLSRGVLRGLLLLSLLVQLSFITSTPVGSDDVYRYMWDGKVQAAGINPYQFAPNDEQLKPLHSTLLPASVNHPDMKSVYFPVTQWVFYGGYLLSRENVWGYKLLLLIAHIATLWGLVILLRRLMIPLKYVLLYSLSPLIILQFGLDAHIDMIGLPFLIFGLLFALDGRRVLASAFIALSISIKPVGILLLLILVLREKAWRERALVVLVPSLLLIVQFLPYLFTSNPFEALGMFAGNWTFNGVVFELLNLYYANNQTSRLLCAVLFGISLFLLSKKRLDVTETLYFSILLLLLFSPVVHPWYVGWLTVLLPLVRRWSGIIYSATASLTVTTIVLYKHTGVWEQSALVMTLEYLPVVILLMLEMRGAGKNAEPVAA